MSQEVPLFGSLHGPRISQPFSSAYPAAGGGGEALAPFQILCKLQKTY